LLSLLSRHGVHGCEDLILFGHFLVLLGDECPMLAGSVFLLRGAGGGIDLPLEEISGGGLMGRLRLLLIPGGQGMMIRRRVRLADLLRDGVPWLG
jgi:hypothetical protein